MNLKQLRYFVKVAEAGGFSQASEAVHLAQSALSRHVRLLEEELDARLFNRTGRGVELTEQGHYLLTQAQGILEQLERVESSLRAWYQHPSGSVRLGMTPSTCINGAATLIRELRDCYPDVVLLVSEGVTEQSYARVLDGRLDLALVLGDPRSDLVRSEFLRSERLCVVTLPGVDLPSPVPLGMLEDLTLVLPTRHTPLRIALDRRCAAAGVNYTAAHTLDIVATMKNLVANGDAVAVLPREAVATESASGQMVVHELDDPNLDVPLYVIYRAKQQLGRAAVATLKSVRALFSEG
ncbi:MAG: LysR family transcriptional regulator [Congregibacter sp.]